MEDALKSVIEAVAGASDANERIEELISRMPEGHQAVELLAGIDSNALASPSCSLAFFTVLNSNKYADRLVRMKYDQLLVEMAPLSAELVMLWKALAPLKGDSRSGFLAKASLLLEIACLAWQDSKLPGKMSGSSVLLPLCSDDIMETQSLSTESGAWPRAIWSKMEEVLEELDFTCSKDGVWSYRIDLDNRARLMSGANIKAYVKSGAVKLSPLALARLSQNMVTKLALLQRTVSMYPADHPSIAPALGSFIELISVSSGDGGNPSPSGEAHITFSQ
ncbi:hypothetical protein CSA37_02580 [Candidatus Fermentibacteria bacterium]|nr:MAG: hypothetical protein CSA37_02580 [Candidatus Fermentibacteria bacterium]